MWINLFVCGRLATQTLDKGVRWLFFWPKVIDYQFVWRYLVRIQLLVYSVWYSLSKVVGPTRQQAFGLLMLHAIARLHPLFSFQSQRFS